MGKRSLDRQLLIENVASGQDVKGKQLRGQSADKESRWDLHTREHCDPSDNNQGSGANGVCKTTADTQYNKDVNYARTIGDPLSLDIAGNALTPDSGSVNALADNLYGSDIQNVTQTAQMLSSNAGNSPEVRKYMLMRSAIAKRAVAENSFASITAMKARGTPASAASTQKLLMELGMSETEAKDFVTDNPSYYAQMEALTKKLYQSPVFYSNLMEGRVNVKRQQAAMKSLEVMQERDIYKSISRSEMLFATLLDVYVTRRQGDLDKALVKGRR